MVEEAALGGAVDERADETEVLHAPLELRRAGVRALHRQHGEAREALGMLGDRGGQMVVHLARHGDAVGAGHEIGAGAGVGEHLHGDAGLVHRREALLADLGQRARAGSARSVGASPRPEAAPAIALGVDPADQRGTVKCSSSATTRMGASRCTPNFRTEAPCRARLSCSLSRLEVDLGQICAAPASC